MRKILSGLIILASVLTVVAPAFASPPLRGQNNRVSVTPSRLRKVEGAEMGQGELVRERTRYEGLVEKVKNFLKRNLRFEARVQGIITAIETGSFSLSGEDGEFQVNITDKTRILRKFGGISSLSEYVVGDEVIVFGKFTDETKTVIDAKIVRNNSIQKRWGAFFGNVTVKNTDNFVMQTLERGAQTVYFGTAKFVNRKEIGILYSEVKVGDRIRVKGVWDKILNKISEVTQVKDFSLPAVVPTQAD